MNNQYTYNQPPMRQMPPRPSMPMNYQGGMRKGVVNGLRTMRNVFPKWLSTYPVAIYILALAAVSFMYSTYTLPWYYMLSGVVSVIAFFAIGQFQSERLGVSKVRNESRCEKKIFIFSLILRLLWMVLIYIIFTDTYEDSLGFERGDAKYYDDLGLFVSSLISDGNFHFYEEITKWCGSNDIADMGYGIYVGFIYWLTGSGMGSGISGGLPEASALSILTVRTIKCIISSYTVVLVYRLAKRNFPDLQTARTAAIFCALWPNFWYYCGTNLKETEMVFLVVLFVVLSDQMLRSRKFTAWEVIPVLLIGSSLFGFRTPLAIVALLALVFTIVLSSQRVVSMAKKVVVGIFAVALMAVTVGNQIAEQSEELLNAAKSDNQKASLEWRGQREHGNSFAKYAGKSVFAPLIFTIPFPTMVHPFDGQDVQQLLNGGNFCKNIISCFTIFAMVMLLMSGKWRDYLLPLSFMLGYLVVLTMSNFAQSERFHQPVMPFEMMFAAYGLSIAVTKAKYKRWFVYWCALMFVACIAWSWFKLAGRGLT